MRSSHHPACPRRPASGAATRAALLAAALAAGACVSGLKLPRARADAASLAALAGSWAGTFASPGVDVRGAISFELTVDSTQAVGTALVAPERPRRPRAEDYPMGTIRDPEPQRTEIRFVRATNGEVAGTLGGYWSPRCGCVLVTAFRGRIRGDTLSGRFTSSPKAEIISYEIEGRWQVVRQREAAGEVARP